jgi:Tol biopolymer transport system component
MVLATPLAVGCGGNGGDDKPIDTGTESTGGDADADFDWPSSGRIAGSECLGCPLVISDLDAGTEIELDDDIGQNPAWSPSGSQVVFMGMDGLIVANGDGSELSSLAENGYYPAWSPDETMLAITQEGTSDDSLFALAAVNLGTGAVSTLTDNGAMPSWHPSGLQIAYSRNATDDWMESFADHDIYLLDVETGESTFLTKGMMPKWSPDGNKLAFARIAPDRISDEASEAYYGMGSGAGFDLYVWDSETGTEERFGSLMMSFGQHWFGGLAPVLGWVGGSRVLLYQDVAEEDMIVSVMVYMLNTETGDSSDAPTPLLNPSWHVD